MRRRPGGAAVSSEVNGLAVMLNGYYDIGTFEGFTPYLGGGVGIVRLETTEQAGTMAAGDTSTNFAWALNVGSAIDLGNDENTLADVSYRFVSLGKFKQQDGTTYDDLMVHEFRPAFGITSDRTVLHWHSVVTLLEWFGVKPRNGKRVGKSRSPAAVSSWRPVWSCRPM